MLVDMAVGRKSVLRKIVGTVYVGDFFTKGQIPFGYWSRDG